eukprot:TRINITY_DN9459_c0_g1_i8.p1 TRINITY_DN9459_c0_g1~~TRINITY_DN9459_c0_g1_i8.p1  ORF type:complete len:212 (+),score=31.13 TRINITY_DN9459_c0_g1_i8:657-1292(+)
MELREDRSVTIRRNGSIKTKKTRRLLVGDIVFVGQGDKLPVDCVLISGNGIMIDESSQTGESKDVEKSALKDHVLPDEEINPFLLSGTIVKEGKGEAVVCAVGRNTRMGRIEEKLEEEPEPTPLQIKLEAIVMSNPRTHPNSHMQGCYSGGGGDVCADADSLSGDEGDGEGGSVHAGGFGESRGHCHVGHHHHRGLRSRRSTPRRHLGIGV